MENDRVRLMHYDPRWRQEFRQTQSGLLQCGEGWITSAEHIGSTAISGLIARPTIDIVATVESIDALEPAAALIEGLHFGREKVPHWIGSNANQVIVMSKPRHLVSEKPDPTHWVLLTIEKSSLLQRVLSVRDLLRNQPELAIDFEEAKVATWRNGEGDFANYTKEKSVFFKDLESRLEK